MDSFLDAERNEVNLSRFCMCVCIDDDISCLDDVEEMHDFGCRDSQNTYVFLKLRRRMQASHVVKLFQVDKCISACMVNKVFWNKYLTTYKEEDGDNATPYGRAEDDIVNVVMKIAESEDMESTASELFKSNDLSLNAYSNAIKVASSIKNVERNKIRQNEIKAISLFKWQAMLLSEVLQKADYRKVIWIYDPVGDNGKTMFTNYLSTLHYSTVFPVTGGKGQDILYQASKYSDIKVCIFDICRSMDGFISYHAVENIKSGHFTTTKYQGRVVNFGHAVHLIIFSNGLPDTSKLSSDRWDIRELVGIKGDAMLCSLRIRDVVNMKSNNPIMTLFDPLLACRKKGLKRKSIFENYDQ